MAPGALVKKDYIYYVVGLDYGVGDLKLSAQFIQKIIFDYDDYMNEQQYGNTMTFLARYEAMRARFGRYNDNAMIYTKIKYRF